jgi:5,5'-dehydrodivanillate O-demethylase
VGASLQFRVPVDDYNTLHMMLDWRPLESEESINETVPFREVPFRKPNGEIELVYDFSGPSYDFGSPSSFIAAAIAQDQAAWVIEGAIMDRTTERLGVSDVGIIMFRRLLEEQMQLVESSDADPMNTYRDPATNAMIQAPCERFDYTGYEGIRGGPFANIEVNNDVEVLLSGEGSQLSEWR